MTLLALTVGATGSAGPTRPESAGGPEFADERLAGLQLGPPARPDVVDVVDGDEAVPEFEASQHHGPSEMNSMVFSVRKMIP